jgi:hypothetical protein
MFKNLLIVSLVSSLLLAKVLKEDFESQESGKLPKNWSAKMTNSDTNSANWQVEEEAGNKILSLKGFKKGKRGPFNLCFTKDVDFGDGEISVRFRANSGKEDQGGGIVWRVKDRDNYYVARFNPLEDNFRFYYIKDGQRHLLKSATLHLKKGWHTMKIRQKGSHFEGYIDGKKYLEFDDEHIKKGGGVGLWTKSDAATSFDEFKVEY